MWVVWCILYHYHHRHQHHHILRLINEKNHTHTYSFGVDERFQSVNSILWRQKIEDFCVNKAAGDVLHYLGECYKYNSYQNSILLGWRFFLHGNRLLLVSCHMKRELRLPTHRLPYQLDPDSTAARDVCCCRQ